MEGKHLRLYEKHRPRTLADMAGQAKAAGRVQAMIDRGALAGNAYLVTGASGTGKTTLAHIMAGHVAEGFNVQELDACDCTPARISDIEQAWQLIGMGDKIGRAWIVNEVHTMSGQAVGKWLTAMERIPAHCIVIFTTTADGFQAFGESKLDAKPFLSRCILLALAQRGLAEPFAVLCRNIARDENLDGRDVSEYLKLARKHNNNLRAMLQAIEAGDMMPA